MISNESINYSLRNLKHRKSRSALTIFSILIGITTLFIFVSFGVGLYGYVNNMMTDSSANKLLILAKGSAAPGMDDSFIINDTDLNAIKKVAGVEKATGVYFKPVAVKQGNVLKYTFLVAYDPQYPLALEVSNINLESGRLLRSSDSNKVLLGYNYLTDNKIFKDSYSVGDTILIDDHDIKVVGFLSEVGSPPDDSQIYTTTDYFKELYPETQSYAMIVVESNEKDMSIVIGKIEKKLRQVRNLEEGNEDFYVQSFDDLIQSYASALNIVVAFIILIALISVLVSSVNTANTMITSVLERFKEIGVLKSIGARNSEIFKIFLFESSFLGFVAGCLGVFFGWLFVFFAHTILKSLGWGFLTPSYSPYLFIACILFATITGAISGVIPARNASRINAVDALRYE